MMISGRCGSTAGAVGGRQGGGGSYGGSIDRTLTRITRATLVDPLLPTTLIISLAFVVVNGSIGAYNSRCNIQQTEMMY